MPESGMAQFKIWLETEPWTDLYQRENAHDKAEILQNKLLEKLDKYFPQKTLKIRSDDREWISQEIKCLDRRGKREYSKRKKSLKWEKLNKIFLEKCQKAKKGYAENIVNDLKSSDVSQWYSKIKRMSSHFKENEDDSEVQDMIGMSNKDQAEHIADQFAEISQIF